MGFLKFLQRKKRNDIGEFDLPPAPPPLEGFEGSSSSGLPDFGIEDPDIPDFNFPDELKEKSDAKSFSDFETKDKFATIPTISAPPIPEVHAEELEDEEMLPEQIQPAAKKPVQEKVARMPFGTSLYIRVDKFKATLGSINVLRNDLKKADEALMKLENIKVSEEKSISRMKSSLDDLQKKLVFIDKTLFEGE